MKKIGKAINVAASVVLTASMLTGCGELGVNSVKANEEGNTGSPALSEKDSTSGM